ncbi:MAG: hypothetical protein ACLFUJ_02925 [Phycisphaerae bacterium]
MNATELPRYLRNRGLLWAVIRTYFSVTLAHRSFSPGHSTPLDFISDALANPGSDIAAWSCRSGGKTLCASILAALEFAHCKGLQGRVLSGSQQQAKNLYRYWADWCNTPLRNFLDEKVASTITRINGGQMEILSASQQAVRGPKVNRLFADELDEIEPEVDAAAAGMVVSRDGIPGRTVYTSTWHRTDGPMGQLIERSEHTDLRLHRWNIWEAVGTCPPDRHENGAGCAVCCLAEPCLAKARQYHDQPDRTVGIAAEAAGLIDIADVIKVYQKVSSSAWQAEYLCSRPTIEGLVFPEFDAGKHRRDPPDTLVRFYRSIDWGHGVFVCLWIGEDRDGSAYVLDTYRAEQATLQTHADFIRNHPIQDVEATFCDPAGRNRSDQTGLSNIEIFRQFGIRCSYTLSPKLRNVRNGLELIRSALAPAAGEPRLFYAANPNNLAGFVKAMQNYRNRRVNGLYTDEPQDPQLWEHVPDALRYYFVNRQVNRSVAVVGYTAL